jgi:hypothetical protein
MMQEKEQTKTTRRRPQAQTRRKKPITREFKAEAWRAYQSLTIQPQ